MGGTEQRTSERSEIPTPTLANVAASFRDSSGARTDKVGCGIRAALRIQFLGRGFRNRNGGHRTGRPPHTTMKGHAIYIPWVKSDRESLNRQKFRPSLSQILPLLFLNIPGPVPIRPVVVFERRLGYTSRPRASRGYQRLNLRTLSTLQLSDRST